jgi:5'-nucleotidase
MLEATEAEIALLNSGTLRSDRIHPKGEFKIRDLLSILPFPDLLVVIEVTG